MAVSFGATLAELRSAGIDLEQAARASSGAGSDRTAGDHRGHVVIVSCTAFPAMVAE
jgi:hypothetical protein